MKIVTIGQPEARKLFAKHWFESTGKIMDDATAAHLQYAINAVEEALKTTAPPPELSWIDAEVTRPLPGQQIIFIDNVGMFEGVFQAIRSGVVYVQANQSDTIDWEDIHEWIPYPKRSQSLLKTINPLQKTTQ